MSTLSLLVLAAARAGGAFNFAAAAEHHTRILADPFYEGRMTLTAKNVAAGDYIESQFKKLGLKPLPGQTMRPKFTVTIGERPTAKNVAAVVASNGTRTWLRLGGDYVPLMGSVHNRLATGEAVFFAAEMPTGDLSGKFAVMLRAQPDGKASFSERAEAAAKLGAKGVVLVGPSMPGRRELPLFQRGQGIASELGLVAIAMTTACFESLSGMKANSAPGALPFKLRVTTELEPNRGDSANVVAMLPGTDPSLKNEYIIIGGHFDHLGHGLTGSRSGTDHIHNGADDNASGTSGVLALAEAFAKSGGLKRTLIFQTYSGEEVGLVGSTAWVRDNPEFIKQTQMMLNMDMIGRLRNGSLSVSAVGSAAEFQTILEGVKVEGLSPQLAKTSPGNSDHAAFVGAKVPSLFFNTGLHDEYHTERDTVETINFQGMGQILSFAEQTLRKLDAVASRLKFVEIGGSTSSGDGSPTRRVRVGFIPDMSGGDGKPGVLVNGASPGSPAEKAGVKAGDRLLEFDGKPINTLEDMQAALVAAKPNVTIKIVVLRAGQRLTLDLTPVPAG